MASRETGSVLGSFFYSLGFLIEEIDTWVSGQAGDARDAHEGAAVSSGRQGAATNGVPQTGDLLAALGAATSSRTLARLLRPRRISWPRAIVAGVAATALAQLAEALERRAAGDPPPPPLEPADLAARYGAGIATAVAYASLLYPRIPGPPLVRGLAFGLLEATTFPSGGAIAALRHIAPRLNVPLDGFAVPGATGATPAAHLAFGLGLGLTYRAGRN